VLQAQKVSRIDQGGMSDAVEQALARRNGVRAEQPVQHGIAAYAQLLRRQQQAPGNAEAAEQFLPRRNARLPGWYIDSAAEAGIRVQRQHVIAAADQEELVVFRLMHPRGHAASHRARTESATVEKGCAAEPPERRPTATRTEARPGGRIMLKRD
jgi:hypothetical protein